jgi:hypothetical protein
MAFPLRGGSLARVDKRPTAGTSSPPNGRQRSWNFLSVGQGFNLGLGDGAQLAEAVIRKTEFAEDLGGTQFLAGSAKARKQDLDRLIFFTDSLVRVFPSNFPPLALARDPGLLALWTSGLAPSACWPGKRWGLVGACHIWAKTARRPVPLVDPEAGASFRSSHSGSRRMQAAPGKTVPVQASRGRRTTGW